MGEGFTMTVTQEYIDAVKENGRLKKRIEDLLRLVSEQAELIDSYARMLRDELDRS